MDSAVDQAHSGGSARPKGGARLPAGGGLRAELDSLLKEHHDRLARTVDQALAAHRRELLQELQPRGGELSQLGPAPSIQTVNQTLSTPTSPGHYEEVRQAYRRISRMSCRSFNAHQVEKKETAKATRFRPSQMPNRVVEIGFLKRWQSSPCFETLAFALIVSNALFFGLEAQYKATTKTSERSMPFEVISNVYTLLFTVELVIRIAADGRAFLWSSQYLWNLIDVVVVLGSLADFFLTFMDVEGTSNVSYVRIIRVARTVRIFRMVRVLKVFTSLRILIYSVLNTLKSLVWTMVLLAIILYIFGVLFTTAATDYNATTSDANKGQLLQYYGSLQLSIYTLFKAITNGRDWADVAAPLGEVDPFWEVVFAAFVTFIYFAVMNVVTGVFCQSAIESANQDKDMVVELQLSNTRLYTNQLQKLFTKINTGKNGVITLNEFEESLNDSRIKAYLDGMDLSADDAWNLFKLLDFNESNSIDIEEFVAGCLRLRGRARSIDIHMLMYESQWTLKYLDDVRDLLHVLVLATGIAQEGDVSQAENSSRGSRNSQREQLLKASDTGTSFFSAADFCSPGEAHVEQPEPLVSGQSPCHKQI